MNDLSKFHLDEKGAVLVIIDIQEKLAGAMKEKDRVVTNCGHLIEISKLKDVPILVTEQYPQGLGTTIREIEAEVNEHAHFSKMCFSCMEMPEIKRALDDLSRKKIILSGMETHVCVLQTCLDLLSSGYEVHVVSDATCSRSQENWKIGLEMMRDAGAVITSTETVLFQLLKVAGSEEFRRIPQGASDDHGR